MLVQISSYWINNVEIKHTFRWHCIIKSDMKRKTDVLFLLSLPSSVFPQCFHSFPCEQVISSGNLMVLTVHTASTVLLISDLVSVQHWLSALKPGPPPFSTGSPIDSPDLGSSSVNRKGSIFVRASLRWICTELVCVHAYAEMTSETSRASAGHKSTLGSEVVPVLTPTKGRRLRPT